MKFKCQCGAIHNVKEGPFTCECGFSTEFNNLKKRKHRNVSVDNIETKIDDVAAPLPVERHRPSPTVEPFLGGGCCGKPSFVQKVKNVVGTMGDFAGSGFKVADKEVYDQRMEICRGCDRFENNRFCKECGCFMDLKAKIEVAECPLDKWPK